jgi:3-deoxy-manno-octulosonate cytidylyltransferase (CMP-KDO synthetase)
MRIIGVIPARLASTRFPGKPLAKIGGIPMIGHVYFRSAMSKALDEVYIATCDDEIRTYADSIGAKCVMTADTHERATDRTAEALLKVEQDTRRKSDIVVMIQGDEPMLHPEMIDEAIASMLKDASINVVNLMSLLKNREEHEDPNEVKVVVDGEGYALYFSREPIPSWKKGAKDVPMLKQVCIIPFRREFLLTFNGLDTTPLERIESVDMLRALEHGYKVKMVMTSAETYSVDTPADLAKVADKMRTDPLVARYERLQGRV